MFKKLKDKLTEEVKIPSQKFTQSMQQLAQAVVSPASSNSSTVDTASNDNFSIDGDFDDTPQNSPTKKVEGGVAYRGGQATPIRNSFDAGSGAGFTHVDLQQNSSTPKMPSSLQSSFSSLASDSSFMFPVLESSGPTYNFQSDLESCSEASESVGPNINKEQLLVAYQKIQQKYHKYKGRYSDLARHYRDLERDNKNAKHILTECQDKALRRMTELKEQCNLEKQAKAHLEEALRSDLEEKDHLIHTLKTKIKLLRNQVDQTQTSELLDKSSPAPEMSKPPDEKTPDSINQEDLLTGGDSSHIAITSSAVLTPEPANVDSETALKEKLKKLETLLHKCKEDITKKRENIKQLETDKLASTAKIEALQQQLVTIQRREEEASLSLAKNKQTIHLELESKEDEIKKLNAQLAATNSKVSEFQAQIVQIRENSRKELVACKAEAKKISGAEMEELIAQKMSLEDRLSALESECKSHDHRAEELQKRLDQQQNELNPLRVAKEHLQEKLEKETTLLKEEVTKLQEQLKNTTIQEHSIKQLKPILKAVKELHGIHKQLKNDFLEAQSDSFNVLGQESQLIQQKIQAVMTGLTQKHQKVLEEMVEQKRESLNAQESLATVKNKFEFLEQTLSTEKSEVEARITDLLSKAKEAEQKIRELEQIIESEKSLRHSVEEESSQKIILLQKKLDEEQDKNRKILEESTSFDSNLRAKVDQLEAQLKEKEQDHVNLADEYEGLKERASTLQISCDQLQQELDFLKTRDRESMNELTSMQMLLTSKNSYVEQLESKVSEIESNLMSSMTEKDVLEKKLKSLEAKLLSQISVLSTKNQEAYNTIKDLQEKAHATANELLKLNALQNEVKEKESQVADLKKSLSEAEMSNIAINEIQSKLEDMSKKCEDKEVLLSMLQEENQSLMECVHRLESCDTDTAEQVQGLQNSNAELKKTLEEKMDQLSMLSTAQESLLMKIAECNTLNDKLAEVENSFTKIKKMLQSKSDECSHLIENIDKLTLKQTEMEKMLHEKSEEIANLTKDLQVLKESESKFCGAMAEKVKEIESYQVQLARLEEETTGKLEGKEKDCEKWMAVVNGLTNEKSELSAIIDNKTAEILLFISQLELVKNEFEEQSKTLREKGFECSDLLSKLSAQTADNEKTLQLLRQKEIECEEKEAQLDNLADEMKRVEELSQELHRINDDRDANVEVLSTEASSLAQKVEELTISTQELKEREVNLLGKLEAAQDLEAEYIATKQREEMLLLRLNEVKSYDRDCKANEEELQAKTEKIKELQEENMRLREAGKDLHEVINRAKEAELKCKKLENDSASFQLRVQKAEESELRCSLLEEELETIKSEKSQMSQEIETLQRKSTAAMTDSDNKSLKEPVVEEPCIVKRYADLTESDSADAHEWKEKYLQLLDKHQDALQESNATIAKLKEENLLAESGKNMKLKERLWDRDDSKSPEIGSSANGSFGTVEKLQQQLTSTTNQLKESKRLHRQEVDDLRRILLNHGSSSSHTSSRSDNLEDATELEYLRNILYEYMMGKEPMILARVIAAVVKFDAEQTSKVLQKEQQRLSLLGHLGIS